MSLDKQQHIEWSQLLPSVNMFITTGFLLRVCGINIVSKGQEIKIEHKLLTHLEFHL